MTFKDLEKQREYMRHYRKTSKYKEYVKKYRQRPEVKKRRAEWDRRYRARKKKLELGNFAFANEHDRGWFEALVDGEGCIGFYKSKLKKQYSRRRKMFLWSPRFHITNTCLELLENTQRIVNGMGVIKESPSAPNSKTRYVLNFSANDMRLILPQTAFISKEKQRFLLLEALPLLYYNRGKGHESKKRWKTSTDMRRNAPPK